MTPERRYPPADDTRSRSGSPGPRTGPRTGPAILSRAGGIARTLCYDAGEGSEVAKFHGGGRCQGRKLRPSNARLSARSPSTCPPSPTSTHSSRTPAPIVESGRLSSGPFVERLEARLGPWLGDRPVVAVSNASDGLIAALAVVAPPGSEVIIPGYTYLATWQAVVWAGMVPVVADVDAGGLLDPDAVEAAIGPRTGAILAVHLTGAIAPMHLYRAIADRWGAVVVADAAHALGARTRTPPTPTGPATQRFSALVRPSRSPRARAARCPSLPAPKLTSGDGPCRAIDRARWTRSGPA